MMPSAIAVEPLFLMVTVQLPLSKSEAPSTNKPICWVPFPLYLDLRFLSCLGTSWLWPSLVELTASGCLVCTLQYIMQWISNTVLIIVYQPLSIQMSQWLLVLFSNSSTVNLLTLFANCPIGDLESKYIKIYVRTWYMTTCVIVWCCEQVKTSFHNVQWHGKF